MGQNYFKTSLLFVIFILIFGNKNHAQSILLNLGAGINYYQSKLSSKPPNNFDPSFPLLEKGKTPFTTVGIELKYAKYSFEINYTRRHIHYVFGTQFSPPNSNVGGAIKISTQGRTNQFQFGYNKFYIISKKIIVSKLILGGGVALGLQEKDFVFEGSTSFFSSQLFVTNTDSIIYSTNFIKLAKVGLGVYFKAGINIYNRFNLFISYHYNFNRMVKYDINYQHNATKYSGVGYGKPNNFSITGTIPIPIYKIKRKK